MINLTHLDVIFRSYPTRSVTQSYSPTNMRQGGQCSCSFVEELVYFSAHSQTRPYDVTLNTKCKVNISDCTDLPLH